MHDWKSWKVCCPDRAYLNLKVLQPSFHGIEVLDSKCMVVAATNIPWLRFINVIDLLNIIVDVSVLLASKYLATEVQVEQRHDGASGANV